MMQNATLVHSFAPAKVRASMIGGGGGYGGHGGIVKNDGEGDGK